MTLEGLVSPVKDLDFEGRGIPFKNHEHINDMIRFLIGRVSLGYHVEKRFIRISVESRQLLCHPVEMRWCVWPRVGTMDGFQRHLGGTTSDHSKVEGREIL